MCSSDPLQKTTASGDARFGTLTARTGKTEFIADDKGYLAEGGEGTGSSPWHRQQIFFSIKLMPH
jgi:hypothetical protein